MKIGLLAKKEENTKGSALLTKCRSRSMLMMAMPGIIFLIIFAYIPMVGVMLAFKDFRSGLGFFKSAWAGMTNFEYIFKSQDAVRIISNTLGYNFMFIIVGTIFAIIVALLLDSVRSKIAIKSYQTSFFLPYFISWVLVGFMARILFEYDKGVLNKILLFFGANKLDWYQTREPWRIILVMASVWKNIGFQSVIYYGSIMSIDSTLFEAADIDGCNKFNKIRCITIPLIKPTVIILTILAIGNIMRADFGLFYYVPNNTGTLYSVTDVIDTYIYRTLTKSGSISAAAAAGLFQSVVGFVLVMVTNWITKKINEEMSLI